MLRILLPLMLASVIISSASPLEARESSSGFTITVDLKKASYLIGEELEGDVVIQSAKSGFPATFNVKIYHNDRLRYTKIVHLPQIYFGTEAYSLETFGIKGLSEEPGSWRIVVGQSNGADQAQATFEVMEDGR